jgi:regulator of protease activity HflC (stomatin/prohibitin superfamily)
MRSKAQSDQAAEVIRAEGRARATAILADAEANRIRKLDDAMSRVSGVMAQRELIKAAGETLGETKSSIILAHSMADVTSLLGSGGVLASNKLGVRLAGSEAQQ